MAGIAWDPARGFWERVIPQGGGCWLWTGATDGHGYGQVSRKALSATPIKTHRLAWTLTFGDPGDMAVMHKCDVRLCCNPAHLMLGTIADNNADMRTKGRGSPPPRRSTTRCLRGHPLTAENRAPNGPGKYTCRTCKRLGDRERYAGIR